MASNRAFLAAITIVLLSMSNLIAQVLMTFSEPPATPSNGCRNYGCLSEVQSLMDGFCCHGTDSCPSITFSNNAMNIDWNLQKIVQEFRFRSVRYAFATPIDLSGRMGLRIEMAFAEKVVDFHLKFTICEKTDTSGHDIKPLQTVVGRPGEELWWYDTLISANANSWETITMPFSSFGLGYGDCVPLYDGNLSLENIFAWEINAICAANEKPNAVKLRIREISVY